MGRNKNSSELPGDWVFPGVGSQPSVDHNQENNTGSQEGSGGMVKNRFDLEQELLDCWKVTDDIKVWCEQGADTKDFEVLIAYYERKFNRLWDTFESMTRSRKIL